HGDCFTLVNIPQSKQTAIVTVTSRQPQPVDLVVFFFHCTKSRTETTTEIFSPIIMKIFLGTNCDQFSINRFFLFITASDFPTEKRHIKIAAQTVIVCKLSPNPISVMVAEM